MDMIYLDSSATSFYRPPQVAEAVVLQFFIRNVHYAKPGQGQSHNEAEHGRRPIVSRLGNARSRRLLRRMPQQA